MEEWTKQGLGRHTENLGLYPESNECEVKGDGVTIRLSVPISG